MSYNRIEVLNLIASNDKEGLKDYFNNLLEKSKTSTKQMEATVLYMLLTVLLYFILINADSASVSLGPLSLSNRDIIIKLIPMIFGFLMIRFIMQNDNGNEIQKVLTLLAHKIYNQEYDEREEMTNNLKPLIRVMLPSLFWIDIRSYFSTERKNLGFLIIPLLPYMFVVLVLPYIF